MNTRLHASLRMRVLLVSLLLLTGVFTPPSRADYTEEERQEILNRYHAMLGAGSECYDREHELSDLRVANWITRIGKGMMGTPGPGPGAGVFLQILGSFAATYPENHRCLCMPVRVTEIIGKIGDDPVALVVERRACLIAYPVRCSNPFEKCCYKPTTEVSAYIEITPAGMKPDCE